MNSFARKLTAALVQVQGSSIATIDTETVVELSGGKKNPMVGKVIKRAQGARVMFFTNTNSNAYNNMVQRRLVAEGKNPATFVLGERRWGKRLPETPLIQHNDQLYAEAVFLAPPKTVQYFYNGNAITKEAIVGLKDDKESEQSQGGLDDKVVIRTFKLESIKRVKMGALSVEA